jgi:TRAP-type C4-dicarboxylate transport system substrate-binding protein
MSTALATLGVTPVVIAYNETALAIANGAIDGAAVDIATMLDVGTSRLTETITCCPSAAHRLSS